MKEFIRNLWRAAEIVLVFIIIIVHWYPDSTRVQSLLLFIPLFMGRYVLFKRLITRSPLDLWLLGFIALCILNISLAPYSWGYYMISRAVMGAGIVWVVGDWGRDGGGTRRIAASMLIIGAILGVVALFTSQYVVKSQSLDFITDRLPTIRDIPIIKGGFNVNEIGGIMTAMTVFAAAFAMTTLTRIGRPSRVLAWIALLIQAFALFLGQSRLALLGALIASGMLILALIPSPRRRTLALIVLVACCLVEAVVVLNLFSPPQAAEIARETSAGSNSNRLNIWSAALAALRDYPLTGVGINEFRSRAVRALYPVPAYENSVLPHAHNILLQVGDDLGIPGLIVYIGWTVVVGVMLRRIWKRGDGFQKTAAAAVAGGLIAHLTFSIADAITLFDRFIFLYWLLVALTTALYVEQSRQQPMAQ